MCNWSPINREKKGNVAEKIVFVEIMATLFHNLVKKKKKKLSNTCKLSISQTIKISRELTISGSITVEILKKIKIKIK